MSSVFLNQQGNVGSGQIGLASSQPRDDDFLVPDNSSQNNLGNSKGAVMNPMLSAANGAAPGVPWNAASLSTLPPIITSKHSMSLDHPPLHSARATDSSQVTAVMRPQSANKGSALPPPPLVLTQTAVYTGAPSPAAANNATAASLAIAPSDVKPQPVVCIEEVVKAPVPDFDPSRNRFGEDEFPEQEEAPLEDTYSILVQTFFIVCTIIAAKILMREKIPWKGEIELTEISLVFTGLFFLLGIMFSNVNADLKEAEKMPMDVVSSLDQLEDSFILSSSKVADKVNIAEVQSLLLAFAISWRDMMLKDNGQTYGDTLHCLSNLVVLVRDWDKKGAANTAPIIVVIDKIRRVVSRGTVVQRTEVLPAARALLNFFVFMSCVLLFLASYKTLVALSVVMSCVMTVCIFMARIIQAMDDPFNIRPPKGIQRWIFGHMAAVQVFPLTEYITRMERRKIRSDEAAQLRLQTMAGVMISK